MKKLMSIMLALALTTGVATITLAQDSKEDTKKATKKGKAKKAKSDTTGDDKSGDAKAKKGKGKKGADTRRPRRSKHFFLFETGRARVACSKDTRRGFWFLVAFQLPM